MVKAYESNRVVLVAKAFSELPAAEVKRLTERMSQAGAVPPGKVFDPSTTYVVLVLVDGGVPAPLKGNPPVVEMLPGDPSLKEPLIRLANMLLQSGMPADWWLRVLGSVVLKELQPPAGGGGGGGWGPPGGATAGFRGLGDTGIPSVFCKSGVCAIKVSRSWPRLEAVVRVNRSGLPRIVFRMTSDLANEKITPYRLARNALHAAVVEGKVLEHECEWNHRWPPRRPIVHCTKPTFDPDEERYDVLAGCCR
jgi:hypothetical protein